MFKETQMRSLKGEDVEDRQFIVSEGQSKKGVYFAVLTLLGLLNNLGFVLINSSAQQLGNHFGQEKLMSLFTFCLTLLGIGTGLFNSKFLLKVRHLTKIQITLTCYTLAYLCVGVSNLMENLTGFSLCLFGSIVMGVASTLGEQTNLGFLKGFAPDLISGWACGTGFAGVFGAGINLLLRFLDIPGYLIFLGMIPISLIYLALFIWLKNQKVHQLENVDAITSDQTHENEDINNREENADQNEAAINQTLSTANVKRIWPMIWGFALNLGSVYFLEYGIITGFADVATDEYKESKAWMEKYAFIILNLCYQVGVAVSRSSLVCFKIRRVWIVTLLQFFNYIIWAKIAYTKEVNIGVLFMLMIWVGLMGGASYVNVLYQVLESEKIEKKDKEISINVIGMMNTTGVLSASLVSLLLVNTVYKNK